MFSDDWLPLCLCLFFLRFFVALNSHSIPEGSIFQRDQPEPENTGNTTNPRRPAERGRLLCEVQDLRDYWIYARSEASPITGGSAFNIKANPCVWVILPADGTTADGRARGECGAGQSTRRHVRVVRA